MTDWQVHMNCESITMLDGGDLEEVEALFAAWKEAVRDGDLDAMLELITEDAEFWTHGQPPLRGRDAVRTAFAPVLDKWVLDQAFECHELILAGELALARGMEVNRLTPREGGEAVVQRQRAFSVLRRGDDGRWRFMRGMTNS